MPNPLLLLKVAKKLKGKNKKGGRGSEKKDTSPMKIKKNKGFEDKDSTGKNLGGNFKGAYGGK